MKPKLAYTCPVCGYQMNDPAEDYNICLSCGTEFGLTDSGRTFKELRDRWIEAGAQWHSRVTKMPKDWNPSIQMLNAGLVDITFGSSETITLDTDPLPVRTASESVSTVAA